MRAAIIAFMLVVALAPAASAQQRSKTDGFRVSIHVNGSAIKVEESDEIESGGGIGFAIGFGLTENLMVYLGADAASISAVELDPDYTLAHGDLGLRFSFANSTRALVPFLQAAATARIVSYDELGPAGEDFDISGMGASVGGGLGLFVSRNLSLEAGLTWSLGKFTDAALGGDERPLGADEFSATSTRFNIGGSWYPGS